MYDFFNLADHPDVQIPMYGRTHLITVIILAILLILVLMNPGAIKRYVNNRRLVKITVFAYLFLDFIYWGLIWGYRIDPLYERFPFHLCGSLSLLMPILILTDRRDLFRFFSYWSIGAGFISYANPGFVFYTPGGWGFYHYLLRHYFLFLAPVIFQIGWGYQHNYRRFLISIGTLTAYALVIFLVDWATGANYMHLGRHNPLEIPFLPPAFTVWPWSYPSFVGVGVILLHLAFVGLRRLERVNLRV